MKVYRRFDPVPYPARPREAAAWDAFWQTYLAQASAGDLMSARCRLDDYGLLVEMDELFTELGLKSVLFAGGGISLLPNFLSHYGYAVDMVDFSAVALEYARKHSDIGYEWRRWFLNVVSGRYPEFPNKPSSLEPAKAALLRLGGTLEYRQIDLFEVDFAPGSYDAVVCQRLPDALVDEDRRELLRRFEGWIRPGGVLVIASENPGLGSYRELSNLDREIQQLGFVYHNQDYYEWRREIWGQDPYPAEEVTRRQKENHARSLELTRKGGKLAVVRN